MADSSALATSSLDITFQPSAVVNNVLSLHNNASAANGLLVTGRTATSNVLLSLLGTATGLSIDLGSKEVRLLANPAGGGGFVVAASDAAQYGSGIFNGAVQIFHPASGALSGMPWLLMGTSAGDERLTLALVTNAAEYFNATSTNDNILRNFTPGKLIHLGIDNGTANNAPTLVIGNGSATIANGVEIDGQASGTAAVIRAFGDAAATLNLKSADNAALIQLNGVGINPVRTLSDRAMTVAA